MTQYSKRSHHQKWPRTISLPKWQIYASNDNIAVHPWAGVRSDHTWTRWGRRKPWILVGVPLAATGLIALPLAPTLAGVLGAILVTNVGRALFVPPMVAWLGDLFPAAQRSQANA